VIEEWLPARYADMKILKNFDFAGSAMQNYRVCTTLMLRMWERMQLPIQ
jgi:hypothetical protein